MDIAELARRTKIKPERLRYVIDRGTLPNGERLGQGRGSARDLTDAEAFVVAAAAKLIDGGVRKPFARGFVRGLMTAAASHWTAFRETLLKQESQSAMEIADGVYVRMRPTTTEPNAKWVRLSNRSDAPKGYIPVVVVSLDLTALMKDLEP